MVSKAHVLSASNPDFRDIITLHASGVPAIYKTHFEALQPPKLPNSTILNSTGSENKALQPGGPATPAFPIHKDPRTTLDVLLHGFQWFSLGLCWGENPCICWVGADCHSNTKCPNSHTVTVPSSLSHHTSVIHQRMTCGLGDTALLPTRE